MRGQSSVDQESEVQADESTKPFVDHEDIGPFDPAAALAAPEMPCFGIDNFASLDPDSKNKKIATDEPRTYRL